MFDFYFVTRKDEKDTIHDEFSYYYNWISAKLDMDKGINDEGLLKS